MSIDDWEMTLERGLVTAAHSVRVCQDAWERGSSVNDKIILTSFSDKVEQAESLLGSLQDDFARLQKGR
ncbi:unnamed protein product [marine sediment metagenome]|uniref:Uncharacterized protein n=1 Tax=marine sediment metagenome TaxID=412755 RepID=X1TZB7_9ZZZZ